MSDVCPVEISFKKDIYDKISQNAINKRIGIKEYIVSIVEEDVSFIKLENGFMYKNKDKKLFNSLGIKINLTRKEEKVLEILIENLNTVVPLEKFYEIIWNGNTNSNTLFSLRNFISSIRDKTSYELIKNKSSQGYIINGRE